MGCSNTCSDGSGKESGGTVAADSSGVPESTKQFVNGR